MPALSIFAIPFLLAVFSRLSWVGEHSMNLYWYLEGECSVHKFVSSRIYSFFVFSHQRFTRNFILLSATQRTGQPSSLSGRCNRLEFGGKPRRQFCLRLRWHQASPKRHNFKKFVKIMAMKTLKVVDILAKYRNSFARLL